MFEKVFKEQLTSLTADEELIENYWQELRREYSGPGRYYHTLSHLDTLINELVVIKERIADWQVLVFSIAYHDIIYSPLKSDNEERSANFAYERLSQLKFTNTKIKKCVSQILATRDHEPADDSDTNYFIDADLAILGANEEQYRQYSSMIRKEFEVYPGFVYKTGRLKVLRHFLGMTHIYKTIYFREKYEDKAKQNLNKELNELDS